MLKNKGLNPAHFEIKTILSDLLEPMHNELQSLFDERGTLDKKELELGLRQVRASDPETQIQIAKELQETVLRLQIVKAEIERKRTCVRAFLMYAGQAVNRVRHQGQEPDFKPKLSDYEESLLGKLTDLEPRRYELA